jgi:hypothetical protein
MVEEESIEVSRYRKQGITEQPGGTPPGCIVIGASGMARIIIRVTLGNRRVGGMVTFAHVCETGGSGRIWLRDLAKVQLRHLPFINGVQPGRDDVEAVQDGDSPGPARLAG